MKQPNLLKFLCSILIGAGLCFVAAGCVQLERKYPDIRTYSLDVSSQGHGSYAGLPVSLRLNSFSSVPQAVDRYLLYRTGETAYESDFYNQLMTAPAEMIHDQ
ncbi:MAG TPA: hypothetical protein PLL75_07710, partial [Candidatus Omnitrophota bacterium]|nr:hypothetical protein [Candidatus Omnitrophota bacterium]